MKGSLIVLLFFMAGCILGIMDIIPLDLQKSNLSMYILYALMLQVGLSIGSSKDLKSIVKDIRPKYLLIPLATIIGTLLFSAFASLLLSQWSVINTDYTVQGSITRYSTCHRVGNNSPSFEYLPRNDGSSGNTAAGEIFRQTGTYISCRSKLYGCSTTYYNKVFRKRHDSRSNFPRDIDRPYGTVFRIIFLPALVISRHFLYLFVHNNQKDSLNLQKNIQN